MKLYLKFMAALCGDDALADFARRNDISKTSESPRMVRSPICEASAKNSDHLARADDDSTHRLLRRDDPPRLQSILVTLFPL